MPSLQMLTMDGKPAGELKLEEAIFGAKLRRGLVTEGVLGELANRRVGTHSTKTRAFVSGGGKKPWKQKGTGRARQGSTRSPQWRHGAVVFGPLPREYGYDIPRNQRRAALRSAIASRVKSGEVIVVDRLVMESPKTKQFVAFLERMNVTGSVLIVLDVKDEMVMRSARNIRGVKLTPVNGMTLHDILKHQKLIMTKESIKQLEERLRSR